MAFSAVPYALQNASHSAALFRQALSAVLPNAGGLVQLGDLAVTQTATASMQVQVGVGRCFIPGTNLGNLAGQSWSTQGMYFGLNDATVNLTIGTADQSNPRIDIVVATVNDAFYSGTQNSGVLQVVPGVPAATPSQPATPANSLLLATVNVAALATSITTANITNVTAAPGSPAAAGKGLVALNDMTVNSGASTGLQIVHNIASFTFKANRWYEVVGAGGLSMPANSTALVQIQTCATTDPFAQTTGLTEIMGYNVIMGGAATIGKFAARRVLRYSVDTTLQIKLTTNGQGNSVSISAGGTYPTQLTVIDLGAQI